MKHCSLQMVSPLQTGCKPFMSMIARLWVCWVGVPPHSLDRREALLYKRWFRIWLAEVLVYLEELTSLARGYGAEASQRWLTMTPEQRMSFQRSAGLEAPDREQAMKSAIS